MRARYIVVAVLFLLGFGVKSFVVMAVEAASRAKESVTLDISQMRWGANNLPVEEFQDLSLVFPVFPALTDLKESSSPDFLATIASKER
jgi:hypothetical protein